MALKLYHVPYTSSFRPRWLLEEANQPHELVQLTLSPDDLKCPEYLQIHPLGHVPALVDDDLTLIESAAICLYLAERVPGGELLPGADPRQRGLYYQWICFAMDTLSPAVHPVYIRWFLAAPEDKATVATEEDHACMQRLLAPVAKALEGRPFLLGERLSTADIILGGVLQWAEAGGLLARCPEIRAYHERLRARPAYQRALP